MHDIAASYQEVRAKVAAAAHRAGRDPDGVLVLAVTKTRAVEQIAAVIAAGARDLGENYVQELTAKWEAFCVREPERHLRWHAIGHLQRNKAKYLAGFCELVHTVDDVALADELDRRAARHDRRQPVLIEVNIASEDTKFGVSPPDVARLADEVVAREHLQLRGLMAMTPFGAPATQSRRLFAEVRELAQRIAPNLPSGAMCELSMGMSQDYEIAVEEAATIVRVGTAIFGHRDVG